MKKFWVIVVMISAIGMSLTVHHSTLAQQGQVSITGFVVYPNGKPAPGVRVYRHRSDNPTGLQGGTISHSDGSFILNDLEPGVAYDLCASKPEDGYLSPLFLPYGLPVGGQCRKVMARSGSNPAKVQLQLSNKSGTLVGQLVEARTRRAVANGKVVVYRPLKLEKDSWVLVDSQHATWTPSAETKTDREGRFTISNLPEGGFFVRIEAAGYRNWFFRNGSSESSAQRVPIKIGETTSVVAVLQPDHR
ncbi:hypothetical protein BH20ACI3_BH20ACI3_42950 [soil metagenome]